MDDPFKSPSEGTRPLVWAAGVGALLIVGGVVAYAMTESDGPVDLPPGPLSASLQRADFRVPASDSGLRHLRTWFAEGSTVHAVDIASDGAIAFALGSAQGSETLLVVRDSTVRSYDLGRDRITAVAFDPEGGINTGSSGGALRRVTAAGDLSPNVADVSSGNSVIAFAFDPHSPKSAVMVAGGEVFTALRPFDATTLAPVEMPRARVRSMAFEDGELVVGGDSGAFYAATDDGWDERSLATSGQVIAMGHDANGELVVAQSNGHVFRADGARWERLGQVPRTPFAIGQLTGDRGVTVLASDGTVFARIGRDDFSELPEFDAAPDTVLQGAALRGANIATIVRGVLHVWDGEGEFVSDAASVATPPGTVPGACRLVGPHVQMAELELDTLLRCGDAYYTVDAEGLADADEVRFSGARVSPDDVSGAFARGPRAFTGPTMYARGDDRDTVVRYDGATPTVVARVAPEAGPVRGFAARTVGGRTQLWVADQQGNISSGVGDAGMIELTPRATLGDFQAIHGAEWFPGDVSLHAVADDVVLVVHDETRVARLSADGVLDPMTTLVGPPRALLDFGQTIQLASRFTPPVRVGANGVESLAWPVEGRRVYRAYREGAVAWLLVGGEGLVRCEGPCVSTGLGTDWSDFAPAGPDEFIALTADGAGLIGRP